MKGFVTLCLLLVMALAVPMAASAVDASIGGVGLSYEKWQGTAKLGVCNIGLKLDMERGFWIRFSDETGCDVTAHAFRLLGSGLFGGGDGGDGPATTYLPSMSVGGATAWHHWYHSGACCQQGRSLILTPLKREPMAMGVPLLSLYSLSSHTALAGRQGKPIASPLT